MKIQTYQFQCALSIQTYNLRLEKRQHSPKGRLTIDGRPHPAVILAGHDDFGNLCGREVGETQPDKLASLMQLIYSLEGFGKRRSPVRGVKIADLESIRVSIANSTPLTI